MNCLTALTFIPKWFVSSKVIEKNSTALCPDDVYSTLMKILVMLYFLVMK